VKYLPLKRATDGRLCWQASDVAGVGATLWESVLTDSVQGTGTSVRTLLSSEQIICSLYSTVQTLLRRVEALDGIILA
jgi:hypothetical protein